MILVTAAIIEKDGLILAARRGANTHLAGFWEFPGGKIEEGESQKQCLQRELMEEFSIQCVVDDFFAESIYNYGHKVIQLFSYRVRHVAGSFRLTDHDKICWLPVDELLTLEWAPADIPIVEKLLSEAITAKNLNFYQNNAQRYIDETLLLDMDLLRTKFTNLLPQNGHILDLGCGSGRDSRAFLNLGYTLTATDGSAEIASTTSKYLGQKVVKQLIQDLDAVQTFDGIWASASLLHIAKSQLSETFESIIAALKPQGIWYMSFKCGEEERWDEYGRFFNDYSVYSMKELLNTFPTIEVIEINQQTTMLRGQPQSWLNVFIRKL